MRNKYKICGETTEIYVKYKDQILTCLIDTCDLAKVLKINGTLWLQKHHTGKFYVRCPHNLKKAMFHRFLLNPPPNMVIDHINLNPLDNRKCNLRIVTNAENKQNLSGARADSSTGIRGVRYNQEYKTWYSSVKVNGKYIHLGTYKNIREAKKAVINGRKSFMPYSQEANL